ncbi:EamA-like transporter family protein [Oxobacter pfennigii]|uniref:EamA-like transporter family protein n=1 Tax=Oxobacter pfennigii TaxID=36849 RepID=A0A0P8W468_9CLOT|nr:DMT family transporter [Oxobacter pfennigii]KPU42239.1 EamA-like transporter family protein [Oxobacter pfennigii]
MNSRIKSAILYAVLAAVCYGVSSPISKILLAEIPPAFMASLLYLGAGFGISVIIVSRSIKHKEQNEAKMTKKELPYILGMITLDIAAPILLMLGLTMTTPANASLLNNFEIVSTSLIALLVFKEAIGKRMWIAISLITISSIILSFEDISSFSFSLGSIFVVAACLCWGLENNCTRTLSLKDPLQIVMVKGLGSGSGALIIALITRELSLNIFYIVLALALGFFAYGLSIYFYILAQRELGAARTSAYYAIAPFIGVGLSLVVYNQPITISFAAAFAIMILGSYFAAVEHHVHQHTHEVAEHEHRHSHTDGHHNHTHDFSVKEHSHAHRHEAFTHAHSHTPDTHHAHVH